ncbi:hypothetical protein MBLNU459_g2991t1 [Dothideomycetes sp. NU459]
METYHGHVRTPADAIILFEACRIGLLPRVQRRLSEKERLSIKSGSVFVWDEREAGMRRWTDGKSWSASRVSGSFLTYREMEGKRGGSGFSAPPKANRDGPKGAELDPAEDGPDGYRYKPDGLMKQSFSITTSTGQHLHLISYFARSATTGQNLQHPSNDPQLRHIRPEKGMYPESTVHEQNNIPAVTRGPMTSPAFAPSPHQPANLGTPYGRGAPHPAYPMAYGPPGWAPPSPMHTPPPHYSPYYPHNAPHHPGGYGQSPLQQMHNAYPQHPQQAYAPPLTAFDRAPAPLSNSGLPPIPSNQNPNHHQMPPMHDGHVNHAPPQQYSLPSVLARAPSNEHAQHQIQPSRSLAIDPSLTAPSNHEARRPDPPTYASPTYASNDTSAGAKPSAETRPSVPTVSSATTIPSISSLIHETSNHGPPAHRIGRSSSRSPTESQQRHTQDIPMHKMGYDAARDAQALRHLDKATLRF